MWKYILDCWIVAHRMECDRCCVTIITNNGDNDDDSYCYIYSDADSDIDDDNDNSEIDDDSDSDSDGDMTYLFSSMMPAMRGLPTG